MDARILSIGQVSLAWKSVILLQGVRDMDAFYIGTGMVFALRFHGRWPEVEIKLDLAWGTRIRIIEARVATRHGRRFYRWSPAERGACLIIMPGITLIAEDPLAS